MIYTKQIFGQELKLMLLKNKSILDIGIYAHSTYIKHIVDIDINFREILLTLNTMELGPEFAISYDMLNKIADDLIAGKEVDLNSDEYSEINE